MLLVTSTLSVQVDTPGTEPLVRLIIPVPATAVGVPPHVFATPGVGATVTPAGNASVKSSPVVPPAFAVLSIVNVSVLVPPLAIGSGANAFVNTGETEGGLNSASTVTSLPTVTVHGLVVQPPPEKVTKAPDVAVAVSSTMVPVGTTSEQSPDSVPAVLVQVMPIPVIVPLPAPEPVTVSVLMGPLNSASTVTSLPTVTVHGLVVQPPPEKVTKAPDVAVAVSSTMVPVGTTSEQSPDSVPAVLVQVMPIPVIVPLPAPEPVTVSVLMGPLNSASTVTSLPTVTVHGLVVQPPPEKVTKAPDVAVAVSSTMVPVGTTSEQSPDSVPAVLVQVIPIPVIVPLPAPEPVTVSVLMGPLNSASTVTSLPTVTVHGLVVQPPPEKVTKAPDVAVAVSSTMVPVGTTSEQSPDSVPAVLVQVIPIPVIVPLPAPEPVTVSVLNGPTELGIDRHVAANRDRARARSAAAAGEGDEGARRGRRRQLHHGAGGHDLRAVAGFGARGAGAGDTHPCDRAAARPGAGDRERTHGPTELGIDRHVAADRDRARARGAAAAGERDEGARRRRRRQLDHGAGGHDLRAVAGLGARGAGAGDAHPRDRAAARPGAGDRERAHGPTELGIDRHVAADRDRARARRAAAAVSVTIVPSATVSVQSPDSVPAVLVQEMPVPVIVPLPAPDPVTVSVEVPAVGPPVAMTMNEAVATS